MTGWRSAVAPALTAALAPAALVAGTTGPAAADGTRSRVVFSWQDRRITESSGLADGGSVLFTVNDSGDGPFVYAVDKRTGVTRATTTYSQGGVTDVEALAPGRGSTLWVGDIGDNRHDRDTVAVYRLPGMGRLPDSVDASRYDLAYPTGAPDAETLLVHPRTGRVYVVTKSVLGGTVYAAPRRLRAGTVNRLTPVARVPGVVTDGAFLGDGRRVLLRGYTGASVYRFPGWRLVGTTRLPRQRQGEGVAVSRSGAVYLSTEGAYTPVLRVVLPRELRARAHRQGAQLAAGPSVQPSPAGTDEPASPPRSTGEGGGIWVAGGIAVAALAGWLAFTFARPRGRRRQ